MLTQPRATVDAIAMALHSRTGRSWLCPTELDRMRLLDASARVRTIRTIGAGAVGLTLAAAAPWVGWWTLAPLAFAVLLFLAAERGMQSHARPERVSAGAIALTLILLCLGVALTGGTDSPFLAWTVLPVAMGATRFRPHVVLAGLALTVLLVLIATLGLNPHSTLRDPVPLFATMTLLAVLMTIVRALQAAELHHRAEAIVDPLTGLLNRHSLQARFLELGHQAMLTRQPVCVVLCDIDDFKAVNDRHGHQRGDSVLRGVADQLRAGLHSFDLVYRIGGEEFLVLLPGTDAEQGMRIAERLRGGVERGDPGDIPVTISAGVSAARGTDVNYDSLFRAADEALYEAKRAGRNRVVGAAHAARLEASAADAARASGAGVALLGQAAG